MLNKFKQWMQGRYGYDELSWVMFALGIALIFLSYFRLFRILYVFGVLIMAGVFARAYSKNIEARIREKNIYMRLKSRFISFFSVRKKMWRDHKTMKYIKCSSCKAYLRVPKNRGKIEVTCPKCQAKVIIIT